MEQASRDVASNACPHVARSDDTDFLHDHDVLLPGAYATRPACGTCQRSCQRPLPATPASAAWGHCAWNDVRIVWRKLLVSEQQQRPHRNALSLHLKLLPYKER